MRPQETVKVPRLGIDSAAQLMDWLLGKGVLCGKDRSRL